jgi:hypothetical protein
LATDIEGTKPGTLRKGIKTNRLVNNIDPIYTLPGHTLKPNTFNDHILNKNSKQVDDFNKKQKTLKIDKNQFTIEKENPISSRIDPISTQNTISTSERMNTDNNYTLNTEPNDSYQRTGSITSDKGGPTFGFQHDKYIIPGQSDPMKSRLQQDLNKISIRSSRDNQ